MIVPTEQYIQRLRLELSVVESGVNTKRPLAFDQILRMLQGSFPAYWVPQVVHLGGANYTQHNAPRSGKGTCCVWSPGPGDEPDHTLIYRLNWSRVRNFGEWSGYRRPFLLLAAGGITNEIGVVFSKRGQLLSPAETETDEPTTVQLVYDQLAAAVIDKDPDNTTRKRVVRALRRMRQGNVKGMFNGAIEALAKEPQLAEIVRLARAKQNLTKDAHG